ncbi:hypothetical protein ACLOJK_013450 [Asimina triloba]
MNRCDDLMKKQTDVKGSEGQDYLIGNTGSDECSESTARAIEKHASIATKVWREVKERWLYSYRDIEIDALTRLTGTELEFYIWADV